LSIYHDHNMTSSASVKRKNTGVGQSSETGTDPWQLSVWFSAFHNHSSPKIKEPILTYNQGPLKSNKNQTSCSFLKNCQFFKGPQINRTSGSCFLNTFTPKKWRQKQG
jgi:hypothetical protein